MTRKCTSKTTSASCCDKLERIQMMVHRGMRFDGADKEVPSLIFCTPEGDTRILSKSFIQSGCVKDYYPRPLNNPAQRACQTYTLEEALRFAGKGTRIQLLPGKYYQPIVIDKDHTTAAEPLVIAGMAGRTILCGDNRPAKIYPALPDINDFAFIKVQNTLGVTIKDLHVTGCWPSFLIAENSQHVRVENLSVEDSRYALFASHGCSDFTVTGNYWKQDPTEAIWQDIDWLNTHHTQYAYMNGAFFGSLNFTSDLIFDNNTIEHAYNGLRMVVASQQPQHYNRNVRVFSNHFHFIRDNAIEPEGHALNWHIYHNRFFNNHAAFSFTGVSGGHWLIYGNLGWFDDQPGRPYQTGRGGKIYKFGKDQLTQHTSYIFNNSWYTRSFAIKKSNINYLQHFNNIYQFCHPDEYLDECLCITRNSLTRGLPQKGTWPDQLSFDFDLSTVSFGHLQCKYSQEKEGRVDPAFRFSDPRSGELTAADPAKVRNLGKTLDDVFAENWVIDNRSPTQQQQKPDLGAWQGDQLIAGPEFKKI